jgi:hypothetical protein
MIMQDQSRRLSEPLRWGQREKLAVGTLLTVAVLVVAGLGAFALTSGAPARRDCIDVTFASTLGGAEIQGCGERARRICASGGYKGIADELLAAQPVWPAAPCLLARLDKCRKGRLKCWPRWPYQRVLIAGFMSGKCKSVRRPHVRGQVCPTHEGNGGLCPIGCHMNPG